MALPPLGAAPSVSLVMSGSGGGGLDDGRGEGKYAADDGIFLVGR